MCWKNYVIFPVKVFSLDYFPESMLEQIKTLGMLKFAQKLQNGGSFKMANFCKFLATI